MILLLNQMAFMGLLVSLAMTVLGFAIGLDLVYSIFSFLLSISALSVLILNAFRQFPIARFVVAGFLPFLISFFVVMIGGSFGEESILTVTKTNDRRIRKIHLHCFSRFKISFANNY